MRNLVNVFPKRLKPSVSAAKRRLHRDVLGSWLALHGWHGQLTARGEIPGKESETRYMSRATQGPSVFLPRSESRSRACGVEAGMQARPELFPCLKPCTYADAACGCRDLSGLRVNLLLQPKSLPCQEVPLSHAEPQSLRASEAR